MINAKIQKIFNDNKDAYTAKYPNIPYQHIKVMEAIIGCGVSSLNTITSICPDCGDIETYYSSCGNRNCPLCQYRKTEIWLDKRLQQQLPGPYFMVTFTLPSELRDFMRSSQADAYNILFKAASETLKTFIADKKYTGGDLSGFFGILHTWGNELQYHPHIHFIVPAGALDREKRIWKKAPEGFLAPVHAMSKVFKGKFLELMKKDGFKRNITPKIKEKAWNVNSQYIKGGGEGAIKYLAPYVFRVAISDSRIISVKNDKVSFTVKKKNGRRERTITMDVFEFMRRFLQHVLPSGFMKIRYYGFMGSGCKITHNELVVLVEIAYNFDVRTPEYEPLPERPPRLCEKCGGELQYISITRNGFTILLLDG